MADAGELVGARDQGARASRFKPELTDTYLYKDGEFLEEICEEAPAERYLLSRVSQNTTTSITTEYRECMNDALMRADIQSIE